MQFMENGYARNQVLLESGTFECDGRSFEYDGEPITVGDVVDNHRISFKTVEGHSGSFHITETHHIMMMVHTSSPKPWIYGNTYDEIVYAPTFSEIYPTVSDFIESRIELFQRYQPTKEFKEKVDYCTYKGRLFKDLVRMSEEELDAIDNEEASAGISMSDVEAYVEWLIDEGQNPKNWVEGLDITEEHIDYLVRSRIERGIDKCEKYCSPSLEFFKLAQEHYNGDD